MYNVIGGIMYDKAITILNKISELGYEAYIVGGYPRDKYLNRKSLDIDICTNMPLDIIKKNFKVLKEYDKFGSIIIEYGYSYEITLFRKDKYNNSRYPEITFVKTLKEDLYRRDFTINTLCIDLNGNYIDLYNAKKDIDEKIIKMIDNTDLRLKEDPLRILRAIRFSLILDFKIDAELEKEIIKNNYLISKLNPGLVDKEKNKILKYKSEKEVKEILNKYGLEDYICRKN